MSLKFSVIILICGLLLSCEAGSNPPETKKGPLPQVTSSLNAHPQKWLASSNPQLIPSPSVNLSKKRKSTLKVNQAWTGLIIDARGINLKPSHTAEIYDVKGELIYPKSYDPQVLVEQGLVAYTYQLNSARNHQRAGKHPLIIKVLKAQLPASVVLNTRDSRAIRELRQVLKTYKVVFLLDP